MGRGGEREGGGVRLGGGRGREGGVRLGWGVGVRGLWGGGEGGQGEPG